MICPIIDEISTHKLEIYSKEIVNVALHLLFCEHADDSREKNSIHTVLIEYSKVFDRLNPDILLDKLKNMEVHPYLPNWIVNI